MLANYKSLIKSTPIEIKFNDVVEFNRLAERITAVGLLFSNIIGVYDDYIEFCPVNEPPTIEEIVAWIWTFRPDLGSEILKHSLSNELRLLIDAYQTGDMRTWWEFIRGNG
jgi:hypothetical protein